MKSTLRDEGSLRNQLEDIRAKMEEMENNKRNNLIVYGITNDPRESHSSLHQKVRTSLDTEAVYIINYL